MRYQKALVLLGLFCSIKLISSCSKEEALSIPKTINDIDGNLYHTVIIDKQIWLVENLKVTKFNNGDPITNVTDVTEWSLLNTSAWSYYTNDELYNDPYGKMYNAYAIIDSRKICPKGWHVPSNEEWIILENFILESGASGAGGALKEAGTTHWLSPNVGATNTSGFTALPGGYRSGNGEFPFDGIENLGSIGLWWSSSDYDSENLWIRTMGKYWDGLGKQEGFRNAGLSCRCLMD